MRTSGKILFSISYSVMAAMLFTFSAIAQEPGAVNPPCNTTLEVPPAQPQFALLSVPPGQSVLDCGSQVNSLLQNVGKYYGETDEDGDEISLAGAFAAANRSGGGVARQCPSIGEPVDELPSCSITKENDQFLELKEKNDESLAAVSCQEDLLQSFAADLECAKGLGEYLQQAGDKATQMMAQLDEQFQRGLTQLNTDKGNCEAQEEALNVTESQLDAVLGEAEQVLAAVDTSNQQIESTIRQVEFNERKLPQLIKLRESQLAKECLQEVDPSFQCSPNTPPVGIDDYVACRFQQGQVSRRDPATGQLVRNEYRREAKLATSAQEAAGVKTMLTDLLNEMPNDEDVAFQISQNPGQGQAIETNATFDILSKSDFRNSRFAATLKGLSTQLPIYAFFESRLNFCFDQAKRAVDREQRVDGDRSSTSTIGQFRVGLEDLRDQANALADASISQLNRAFQNAKTLARDKNHLPFSSLADLGIPAGDINRCRSDFNMRKFCLQQFRTGFEQLLDGTGAGSNVFLTIRGSTTNRLISASGLRGAKAMIQREREQVVKGKQQNETLEDNTKTAYKTLHNQTMTQLAQNLGAVGGRIRTLIDKLSSDFVKNRLDALVVENLDGEEPQEVNGIFGPPQNGLRAIASKTSIPDLTDGGVTDAFNSIGDRRSELDREKGKFEEAMVRLVASAKECGIEAIEKLEDKLARRFEDFEKFNCGLLDGGLNALQELGSVLAEALDSDVGESLSDTVDSLETGITTAEGRKEDMEEEIRKAKNALNAGPHYDPVKNLDNLALACDRLKNNGNDPVNDAQGIRYNNMLTACNGYEDDFAETSSRRRTCEAINSDFHRRGKKIEDIGDGIDNVNRVLAGDAS